MKNKDPVINQPGFPMDFFRVPFFFLHNNYLAKGGGWIELDVIWAWDNDHGLNHQSHESPEVTGNGKTWKNLREFLGKP